MAAADGEAFHPDAFECPGCGQVVEATPGAVARLVDCPACEERFLIQAADGSMEIPETPELTDEEKAEARLGELDGLRLRHLVVVRRAAIRSRTYAVVGMVCCLMLVVKLVMMARDEARVVGWHGRQGSFVACAVAALAGAGYFARRAAYWGRESRAAKMPEPEGPPDFSTLSDGSQHARNLEEMGGGNESRQ